MRRVYRRRSDMLVFTTLAAVILAVVWVYFATHAGSNVQDAEERSVLRPERLVVLPDEGPAGLTLERTALAATNPRLLGALDAAAGTGFGEVADPEEIDAVWLRLADDHSAVPHMPLVVAFEEAHYRLQMMR